MANCPQQHGGGAYISTIPNPSADFSEHAFYGGISGHMARLSVPNSYSSPSIHQRLQFGLANNAQIPLFVVDSGCSHHMCNSRQLFSDMQPDRTPVDIAAGSTIFTQGKGTVGGLRDVFFVPDFHHNLLSVNQLSRDTGIDVLFRHPEVHFSKGNWIHKCRQSQSGLFLVNPNDLILTNTGGRPAAFLARDNMSTIVHNRFGHINDSYLLATEQHELVTGMPPIFRARYADRVFCDACALAKSITMPSYRTPGSAHNISRSIPTSQINPSSQSALSKSLIHEAQNKYVMDLKGPLPRSTQGHTYAFIITSYDNRYRWVYFLKSKNEVFRYLKVFLLELGLLKKATPASIITFKSDNGGEFVSNEIKEYLLDRGIKQETTSPQTPHQNGIAERSNRTVVEMTVSLMIAAHTPQFLWPYAMHTAVWLLNRLPCKHLNLRSTPYFELHRSKPDVSRVRVFGCDVFAHLP